MGNQGDWRWEFPAIVKLLESSLVQIHQDLIEQLGQPRADLDSRASPIVLLTQPQAALLELFTGNQDNRIQARSGCHGQLDCQGLDGVVTRFTSAYSDRVREIRDKYLAVSDLPGLCGVDRGHRETARCAGRG